MTVNHLDEELLVHLGTVAAQADPVPEMVLDLARLAWTTRTLDAELVHLVEQTTGVPAGVRSTTVQPRMLTFEGAGVVLDLQVEGGGSNVRVLGQVLPCSMEGGSVTLEHPDGTAARAELDDLGGFRVVGLGDQLLRVRVELAGRTPFTTTWFTA